MTPFAELMQQGAANAWLFVPSAVLLGALHGLEPGHSKTMMAAFIVAIRGTVGQAIVLGVAATVSHTLVVWAIALGGLWLWKGLDVETVEPWFQLLSAVIIIGIASWMFWRTRQDQRAQVAHHHHHHHDGDHDHHHHHDDVHGVEYEDAHERAHAADIDRRFAGRPVPTGQIALFGLTGGLIPCPAAITVLLLCLQLKAIALGATLVLGFSVGLALTLVTVGVAAALSVRHVGRRFSWFGTVARRAPYVSSLLIVAVGLYMGWHGWQGVVAQLAVR